MRLLRAGSTRASRAAETDKDSPRKREKSKTAKRTGGVSSAVWVIAASIGLSLTAGCRAGRLRGEPAPVPPEVARLVDEAAQRRASPAMPTPATSSAGPTAGPAAGKKPPPPCRQRWI